MDELVISQDNNETSNYSEVGEQLHSLVDAIDDAAPTGCDVRDAEDWQQHYYSLRDLRQSLRREERNLDDITSAYQIFPKWQAVFDQSLMLLAKATKDVEIAGWLVEAAVRVSGFNGFVQTFTVVEQLVSQYGEQLFPLADADDPAERFLPLQTLSGGYSEGTLQLPLNFVSLLLSTDEETTVTLWNYLQTQQSKQSHDEKNADREQLIERAKLIIDNTSTELLSLSNHCLDECYQLARHLEESVNGITANSLNFSNLCSLLQSAKKASTYFSSLKVEQFVADETDDDEENDGSEQRDFGDDWDSAIHHVEAAYRYFKLNQPHSPLTSLLKRVLDWSEKDLADILPELIPNADSRALFCLISGVDGQQYSDQEEEYADED